MEMSVGEICRSYAAAKDKNDQIKVLADLNDCSTQEILDVLTDGGMISGIPSEVKGSRQKALSDKAAGSPQGGSARITPPYGGKGAGRPKGKRATGIEWTVDMTRELIECSEACMTPTDIAERMGLDVAQVRRKKNKLAAAGYIFPRLTGKCAGTSRVKADDFKNGGTEELPPPPDQTECPGSINPLAMLHDVLPVNAVAVSAAVQWYDGEGKCWHMELTSIQE